MGGNLIRTVVGIGTLVLILLGQTDNVAWGMGARPPMVGSPATDFVLVNFWATWCKPCTTEMPAMQAAYDKLRDKGFVVLAVNELEDVQKVIEHIRTYGHSFPVLMDHDNRVANQYGVYGLPVSVFIDEAGIVQEYLKGGLLTEPKIYEVVDRIRTGAQLKVTAR